MQSFRNRPAAAGRARARWLNHRFGEELRLARTTAGLTQAGLARRAGVSQGMVSKAERGIGEVSLGIRCRLAAAAGHELGWRLYPTSAVRLRDSGQLGLARTIIEQSHPGWAVELEVPIAAGDLRAADMVLTSPSATVHIEIERALIDVQAQFRAAQLKRQALAERLGRAVSLVIVVNDTTRNRRRLAAAADVLRRAMPASAHGISVALRSGVAPPGDGILFLRQR